MEHNTNDMTSPRTLTTEELDAVIGGLDVTTVYHTVKETVVNAAVAVINVLFGQ